MKNKNKTSINLTNCKVNSFNEMGDINSKYFSAGNMTVTKNVHRTSSETPKKSPLNILAQVSSVLSLFKFW